MYYDEEFNDKIKGFVTADMLIALELKNIANELHESNVMMLDSLPTHMSLDNNGVTVHYGTRK